MLFALFYERRQFSLYEQYRDMFIDQVIMEIWAFQHSVFGLGDLSDFSTTTGSTPRPIVNCHVITSSN